MEKFADRIRKMYIEDLYHIFFEKGEDIGMIASNSFNFPVVLDGEEGFVEIVVKVPKDGSDDNYLKRTAYTDKLANKAAKAEKAKAKKEKAIAEKAKQKAE